MATPFMIGPEEISALRAARDKARERPIALAFLRRHAVTKPGEHKETVTLADREAHPELIRPESEHVTLPFGYRVAISYEEQPCGICLHLSMSSPTKGRTPTMEAVALVLDALGLNTESVAGDVWLEEFDPGHMAVNVVVVTAPAAEGRA